MGKRRPYRYLPTPQVQAIYRHESVEVVRHISSGYSALADRALERVNESALELKARGQWENIEP